MFRSILSAATLLLLATGCPEPDATLPCGDATYWVQRGAEWPTDAFFLGDDALDQADALDLLELPATAVADDVAAALVVAELNLAAGAPHEDLAPVYAAHAWFADLDATERRAAAQAEVLIEALEPFQHCP